MKKSYYICKNISGCLGGSSFTERLPGRYTNKTICETERKSLMKARTKNVIYFMEFEWV